MTERSSSDAWSAWLIRGVPAGRIRGIEVRLHSTLLLLLTIWVLRALTSGRALEGLGQVAISSVLLFGSILLHELGHCFGAYLVGGESRSILLWPLGGLATVQGAERSPYNEFIITLLGPTVSLALATAATAAVWILPDPPLGSGDGAFLFSFFRQMMILNWILFGFNVFVPLFPMDGSRLIRSLLSMRHDPQKVTYHVCLLGIFTAGAMACLFVVGSLGSGSLLGEYNNVFFILIAAFGIHHCLLEMKALEYSYVYTSPTENASLLRSALRVSRRQRRPERVDGGPEPIEDPIEPPKNEAPLSEREVLEAELGRAVEEEDFRRAAEVRDRLRDLRAESRQS